MANKKKVNPAIKRQQQQEYKQKEALRQKKLMRNLIIGTVAVIAVIVLLIVFIPNNKTAEATTFDYSQLPVKGEKTAPVKIVEFGDFKCPICKQFNEIIVPQIQKDFIANGTAAMYFMNFPFLGPDSTTAALAVESVYHQNNDAFWKYFDAIYTNQGDESTEWATTDFLVDLAKKADASIDTTKLRQDIENKTYAKEIQAQYDKGKELNLPGTPSIYINGVEYTGDLGDYTALKAAIEKAKTEAGSEG